MTDNPDYLSMTDADLRGHLLKALYDARRKSNGGVTGRVDLRHPGEESRLVKWIPQNEEARLLDDMTHYNLVELKSIHAAEGQIILSARILPPGTDVVEGTALSPIAITINAVNMTMGNHNQLTITDP